MFLLHHAPFVTRAVEQCCGCWLVWLSDHEPRFVVNCSRRRERGFELPSPDVDAGYLTS